MSCDYLVMVIIMYLLKFHVWYNTQAQHKQLQVGVLRLHLYKNIRSKNMSGMWAVFFYICVDKY